MTAENRKCRAKMIIRHRARVKRIITNFSGSDLETFCRLRDWLNSGYEWIKREENT